MNVLVYACKHTLVRFVCSYIPPHGLEAMIQVGLFWIQAHYKELDLILSHLIAPMTSR